MAKSIVVTHPEQGIFVGEGLGLGFWTNLDAGGQSRVCAFDDEAQARECISSWLVDNDADAYGYVEVEVADQTYATIDELRDAGLEDQLGDLMSSLVNAPGIGHA